MSAPNQSEQTSWPTSKKLCRQQLTALLPIGAEAIQCKSWEEFQPQIFHTLSFHLSVDRIEILRLSESKDSLYYYAALGYKEHPTQKLELTPFFQHILSAQHPVTGPRENSNSSVSFSYVWQNEKTISFIAMPIQNQNGPWGILFASSCSRTHYAAQQCMLLQALTQMLALFLERQELKDQQELLRKKEQQLLVLNAELQRFTYIASHDLAEPLKTIQSYCELLKEDLGPSLSDEIAEDLHFLGKASTRMTALIEDLLQYSRCSSAEISQETVDLNDCLTEVLNELGNQIAFQQAIIEIPLLPKVLGDHLMLGKLFRHLLLNALKFVKDRPPHIVLSVEIQDRFWRISVQDNGIGIEQQFWQRIFEPFQRLHSRREYEGSGLGLAICKKIVDRLGGHLLLASIPEKGSCFNVLLPTT